MLGSVLVAFLSILEAIMIHKINSNRILKVTRFWCIISLPPQPKSTSPQKKSPRLKTWPATTRPQTYLVPVTNYPISLANGWDYVKQQIGDTRDYIYDMDLMAAEAYVSAAYAAALTELEVE